MTSGLRRTGFLVGTVLCIQPPLPRAGGFFLPREYRCVNTRSVGRHRQVIGVNCQDQSSASTGHYTGFRSQGSSLWEAVLRDPSLHRPPSPTGLLSDPSCHFMKDLFFVGSRDLFIAVQGVCALCLAFASVARAGATLANQRDIADVSKKTKHQQCHRQVKRQSSGAALPRNPR